MAPVKITARSVVVSAGTLVGASGAVYAVGYVIDLSFRDLLGVDRVSYLSTLGLGLNVAQMISAIATALARTVLIHPIIATLTLIAVIAATIYGVLLVVRRQPTVPQPYLYLYLTLLTIVVILKTLYFCLPFTQYDNLLRSRVRHDRVFSCPHAIAARTRDLWQSLVCAHGDLEQCKGTPLSNQARLDADFARGVLLTALFVGVALLLYNRQRARTLGKASPHEFAHLIAGAALIVDMLCLTYIYGKSIRNFTFDEIKFERANTKPTEYGVGLLLSENDKTMIVYDEAEGLPDEVPNTTKSPQGKKDLIHECIAYSNRKAEAPK